MFVLMVCIYFVAHGVNHNNNNNKNNNKNGTTLSRGVRHISSNLRFPGQDTQPSVYPRPMSHPTVGVALFGPKVSDQLSISEELQVRMKK